MTPVVTPWHHDVPGPAVRVEVLLLRLTAGGIAYRHVDSPVVPLATPDQTAGRLAPGATLVHSTSWRYQGGAVVLTYAALPDARIDLPAIELLHPSIVCSGDALHPQPPVLHHHHVAAHAVRHLAYLLDHDPAVVEVRDRGRDSGLWEAIADLAPRIPTSTHDRAHELAERGIPAR